MVARISFPKRLLAALNYNESKCSKGHAECIAAINYLHDADTMNFHHKLSMFESRNELNDRASTKTIHVSLNFDPSEKLSKEKLCSIAEMYMKGIGFAEQPYLIYQHHDAGHPHLHIVSTTIKEDGSRMNTHNLGRNQSEKARKEIEQVFGLVRAEKQTKVSRAINPSTPLRVTKDVQEIIYGESELKRSISNVVSYVFNSYKFSSLAEYNAALKQFNVVADRGKEEGRIFKNKGLVYRVMDEKGNKVGVPIKASLVACKPTLENIEKKYTMNKSTGRSLTDPMPTIINAIDEAMKSANHVDELIMALKAKNIFTVLRQNAEGRIYGITFVDNEHKVVFNGSDLGKGYSASSLLKKLSTGSPSEDPMQTVAKNAMERKERDKETHSALSVPLAPIATKKEEDVLETLLSQEQQFNNNIPFQLRRKKKKKKNKLRN